MAKGQLTSEPVSGKESERSNMRVVFQKNANDATHSPNTIQRENEKHFNVAVEVKNRKGFRSYKRSTKPNSKAVDMEV